MTDIYLKEIEEECKAQILQWGGKDHDDEHNPRDWCAFIIKQLGSAMRHLEEDRPGSYRIRLLKIAALTVSALQSHDRKSSK